MGLIKLRSGQLDCSLKGERVPIGTAYLWEVKSPISPPFNLQVKETPTEYANIPSPKALHNRAEGWKRCQVVSRISNIWFPPQVAHNRFLDFAEMR